VDTKKPVHLYLNFPFCVKKTRLYPDQTVECTDPYLIKRYLEAMRKEIESISGELGEYEIGSVYFGGGPLNLARCTDWQLVLQDLRAACDLTTTSINLRFKPDGFTKDDYFRFYSEQGDYIMLDMVSHIDAELAAAACTHTPLNNAEVHILFSDFGFKRFDAALYYGLAGQTGETLLRSLERACQMYGGHISIHPWSPASCTEKDMASFEKSARDYLTQRGFEEYAPRYFGKPGFRMTCPAMLPATEFLGIGLGALSSVDGLRFCNTSDLSLYIEHAGDYQVICRRL
jgi:oxygen-independent coproporphyrinogen-3 oxidase